MNKLSKLALGAAMAVGLSASANAAVISTITSLAVPSTIDGLFINVVTGGTTTLDAIGNSVLPGWDLNPYASGGIRFFWPTSPSNTSGGVAATSGGAYLNLAAGSVVSSASLFSTSNASSNASAFQSAGSHILGFRFFNESTSVINYGYLNITNGANGGFPSTVTGWSYENTGAAITVTANGAVPEPATWATMLAGFALMGASLRRKSNQTARLRYAG